MKKIGRYVEYVQEYLETSSDIKPLILDGDTQEILKLLPDKCIDLIVTSPPYWQQRDYKEKHQIGSEKTVKDYVNNLTKISTELRRILKDEGSFFLNIGDKYSNKKLLMIPFKVCNKMQRNGWVLRNVIVWYKPNHMPSPLTDRFTNTWEPVFFFVKDTGNYLTPEYHFELDNVRIAHKSEKPDIPLDLPITVSEEDYEKVNNILTKYKKVYEGKFKHEKKNVGASPGARSSLNGYSYSKQRIFKPTNKEEIEILTYLGKYRKKLGLKIEKIDELLDYKYTAGHWFRLDRGGRSLPSPEDWIKLKTILKFDDRYDQKMTKIHYVLQAVKKHPKGKNPGDVWAINTDKSKEAHFAIFPEELVKRIIKVACPENGIVLDHFAGSGTTGKVSMELGRKSIMIDINKKFTEIMYNKYISVQQRQT